MVICPSCGGWKSPRARVCRRCYPTTRVAGGAQNREQVSPIRTIDADRPTTWRPPHLPPICPTCDGFGYVQGDEGANASATVAYRRNRWKAGGWGVPARRMTSGNIRLRETRSVAGGWHACPDCVGHPGSVMSHEAWTQRREIP
jgi:hypothetical protein